MRRPTLGERDMLHVLDRGNLVLGNLHLDLIGDSGARIGPVSGRHEAAGRCGGEKGAADVRSREAELPRPFAIDIDVDAGIIQRFIVLQVAESRNFADFRTDFFSERSIRSEIGSANIDFYRRGSAEIHDLSDDVSGFEGKLAAGEFAGQYSSQTLLELVDANV